MLKYYNATRHATITDVLFVCLFSQRFSNRFNENDDFFWVYPFFCG